MWREPIKDDLIESLSQAEIDKYDSASSGKHAAVIKRTVALVRGYIRSSPKGITLSPDTATIPESLVAPAMDYAAISILKRITGDIAKPRMDAKNDALELFKAIAEGDVTPEPYGADNATGGTSSVELASSSRRRVTSKRLEVTP